jgi:hypothetical protein
MDCYEAFSSIDIRSNLASSNPKPELLVGFDFSSSEKKKKTK